MIDGYESAADEAPESADSVTVVVPPARDPRRLPALIERLGRVREAARLDLEVLLIDGGQPDPARPWVHVVPGEAGRGAGEAIVDGLRRSARDALVILDADLGYPPERLPAMLAALRRGADAVVGARAAERGLARGLAEALPRLGRRAASLLARPLVRLRDPTGRFLALRRSTFAGGGDFAPVGPGIGLELLLKCRCERVVELPVRVEGGRARCAGPPLVERLRYLQHLRRLYVHRYGAWSHLAQFLVVGATGLAVNLLLLTLLLRLAASAGLAVAVAIGGSMLWNFALNRRFSFSWARAGPWAPQLGAFVAACSAGAIVNYGITAALWDAVRHKQLAATAGVLGGTAFNFLASRYVVFRRRRPSPGVAPR